jgi:hypothetical protein
MLQKQRFTSGNIKRNRAAATMLAGFLSIFDIPELGEKSALRRQTRTLVIAIVINAYKQFNYL